MIHRYIGVLYLVVFLVLVAATPARAQRTVEGTVSDSETGETLPGVNVTVQNTQIGVITNADGQFEIEMPSEQNVLVFSFVGFRTQEVTVPGGTTELDVEMEPDVLGLDEVVITGLATSVKRENLANAVSSISAADIAGTTEPQTVDGALQGKLPGVNIKSYSGAPGGGFNVQMRGVSTLGAGNSQPLYIIDGIYVNNEALASGRSFVTGATSGNPTAEASYSQDNTANRLADLNPDEIESIEVLKGASAAAIYGQRANAGVIIIKTKRGRAGNTRVSFSQDVGFNSALNLLGVAPWTEAKIDRLFGSNPAFAEAEKEKLRQAQANGEVFDYEEEVYGENGLLSNTFLSISGGDTRTQFYVSGGVRTENGIIDNTGFDRKSLRANLDHNVTNWLRITSNSSYTKSDTDRGFTGNQNGTGGSVGYALSFVPSYANLFRQDDGTFPDSPYFAENPLRLIEVATNQLEVQRFIQSVSASADLYRSGSTSLSLEGQGGFDILNGNGAVNFPVFMQFQQGLPNPGDVVHNTEEVVNTNLQGFLIFNTEVGDSRSPISLTTQVGGTRFTNNQDREILRGQGLVADQTNVRNAAIQSIFNQRFLEVTDIGFAGQQEANWGDKLIGTVGARFDRSTLNADQEQFYFFPKASLAANLHNFGFWSYDVVNQLKLRAAYGETGGLPTFGNTFTVLQSDNIGGGLGSQQGTATFDPELDPERAREFEAGLDLGLINERVALQLTWYNKRIDDLILPLTPSNSTGITQVFRNAAELENRGWEIGLNVTPIRSRRFGWNSQTLFWTNKSEIVDLQIPPADIQALGFIGFGFARIEEGESPTSLWGLDADGARKKFGDWQPDFETSFSNKFTVFRDFQASFLLHWSEGADAVNLTTLLTDSGGTTHDWNEDDDGDGTPNGLDRPAGSARWIEDASFVRLREVSLYYNVPSSFLEGTFGTVVRNARIGASANNVALWTDYEGYDPEVNFAGAGGGDVITQAVEITPFPSSRSVTFHLKLDF